MRESLFLTTTLRATLPEALPKNPLYRGTLKGTPYIRDLLQKPPFLGFPGPDRSELHRSSDAQGVPQSQSENSCMPEVSYQLRAFSAEGLLGVLRFSGFRVLGL